MTLEESLKGLLDAEGKLSSREAINNPAFISEHMYRLGQYASALEKHLGDFEEAYEKKWAKKYEYNLASKYPDGTIVESGAVIPMEKDQKFPPIIRGLSATAAENQANVDCAEDKGNIKRLTRYVSSSWRIYTGAMARVNHLTQERVGMKHEV